MIRRTSHLLTFAGLLVAARIAVGQATLDVRGTIVDAQSGQPLAARLYVHDAKAGLWYFAHSDSPEGSAASYRKQRGRDSAEHHTTLSPHPFRVSLPPGKYQVTVERGKHFHPWQTTVTLTDRPVRIEAKPRRWIDMAQRGWYSGDTHVHRHAGELPLLMQAEELNVTLPVNDWITSAGTADEEKVVEKADEKTADEQLSTIQVDAARVIHPINTALEIQSVRGKNHTLGGMLVLAQQRLLKSRPPRVRPIAEESRRQGALVALENPAWPWAPMLVPVMPVDLYGLLNSHLWRTRFAMRQWYVPPRPADVKAPTTETGWTERGWANYCMEQYYTLLNCGFRLRVTAGTAHGVHPVPLGFSRVYVHLPDGFDFDKWMAGLDAGRSFVTNGPMLMVHFNGRPPGWTFANLKDRRSVCHVTGTVESRHPIERVEILVNGRVAKAFTPSRRKTASQSFTATISQTVPLAGSSWVAVRCFEKHPQQRVRLAHTNPVFFDVPGHPQRPGKEEVQPLVDRVKREISRHAGVLTDEELAEYRAALAVYEKLLAEAGGRR